MLVICNVPLYRDEERAKKYGRVMEIKVLESQII